MQNRNSLFAMTALLFALLWSTHSLGQQIVSDELQIKQWVDGQTIQVFGHDIKRVFGETYDRSSIRNNHIPFTNVGYKDLAQLIEEAKIHARENKWSDEKREQEIQQLTLNASGGRLFVYLERYENDNANGKYFFVILRDKDDKEFYRQDFGYQSPEFGDFGFWGNLFTINIPIKTQYPFFVYINDRHTSNLSDFKFEVLD